ncbi:hypothetical protein GCM10007905_11600 [Mixta theicola]|nr:hypothetical protein GCM10007905_11600 [Mixta theicola]
MGDQQAKLKIVNKKIGINSFVLEKTNRLTNKPSDSIIAAFLRWPLRSTIFDTTGVKIIFKENDSAVNAAIPDGEMPLYSSHTGQNGMCIPINANILK